MILSVALAIVEKNSGILEILGTLVQSLAVESRSTDDDASP